MTPETVAAIFAGAAALLVAAGGLIIPLVTLLRRTKTIETNTNGVVEASKAEREALEVKVDELEERLVASLIEKLEAATLARQAASDVRAAMETAPPEDVG